MGWKDEEKHSILLLFTSNHYRINNDWNTTGRPGDLLLSPSWLTILAPSINLHSFFCSPAVSLFERLWLVIQSIGMCRVNDLPVQPKRYAIDSYFSIDQNFRGRAHRRFTGMTSYGKRAVLQGQSASDPWRKYGGPNFEVCSFFLSPTFFSIWLLWGYHCIGLMFMHSSISLYVRALLNSPRIHRIKSYM